MMCRVVFILLLLMAISACESTPDDVLSLAKHSADAHKPIENLSNIVVGGERFSVSSTYHSALKEVCVISHAQSIKRRFCFNENINDWYILPSLTQVNLK